MLAASRDLTISEICVLSFLAHQINQITLLAAS